MEEVDDFLAHYGVKGMKRGVRKTLIRGKVKPNSVLSRDDFGKDAKRPKEGRKEFSNYNKTLSNVYKTAHPNIKKGIKRINQQPKYSRSVRFGRIKKEYLRDISNLVEDQLNASAVLKGTSDNKKYRLKFHYDLDDKPVPSIVVEKRPGLLGRSREKKEAKRVLDAVHSEDEVLEVIMTAEFDEDGHILVLNLPEDMTHSEDFLAHYGVKGMRWGVRKDRKPRPTGVARAQDKRKVGGVVDTSLNTVPAPQGKRRRLNGGLVEESNDGGVNYVPAIRPTKARITDRLTDSQLEATVKRMQLEKRYSELAVMDQSKWQSLKSKVIKSMSEYAFQQAMGQVNKYAFGSLQSILSDVVGQKSGATNPVVRKDKDGPTRDTPVDQKTNNSRVKVNVNIDPRSATYKPEIRLEEFRERYSRLGDRKFIDIPDINTSELGFIPTKRTVVKRKPKPATPTRYRRKKT